MNQKDCEQIGWVFSKFVSGEIDPNELIIEISMLDKRIKEEFEAFGDSRDRDQAVMDRFEELMTDKYGTHWMLAKKPKKIGKQLWDQAEHDIPEL